MAEFIHDRYTRKAMELVRQGKSFFITGKAGTGKTCLLNEIVRVLRSEGRRISVIAPTGVAAKNAGGSTIHSFLNLKPLTYIPGAKIRGYGYKLDFDLERSNAIQELDLLIIDEISMVRCDLLDCIDDQLRHYRNSTLPFGGVQILFFGDFYQLPPVLEDEKTEAEMINGYYDSVYAFDSDVWKSCNFPMLELMTNHRQDGDTTFFNLLNKIRVKEVTDTDLTLLNQKVEKGVQMTSKDNLIKLTSLNDSARRTNFAVLEKLKGTERVLPAYIRYYKYGVQTYIDDSEWDGYRLTKDEYPTERMLKLKVGAKVMFLRNEPGLYRNGTIGIVKKIDQDIIQVRTEDNIDVSVGRSTWYFYHDIWDKRNKTYEQYLFATFEQFPLRLAWAVTIHKSQGLTFNKVMIDIRNAFAHGQTYVALSRCKSLSGITLNKDIHLSDIIIDEVVEDFMNSISRIEIPLGDGMNPSSSSTSQFKDTKIYDVMGYKTRSLIISYLDSGKSIQSALETLKAKKPAAWRNTMDQLHWKYPHADIYDFLHKASPNFSSSRSTGSDWSSQPSGEPLDKNYTLTADGKGLKSLKTTVAGALNIGEGIERIEAEACKGCSLITRINLPKSLKSIGDRAFYGCMNIKEVILPDNLISIGTDVFSNTGISSLAIPAAVKSIGITPCGCKIEVDEDNECFTSDDDGMLYNSSETVLLRSPIEIDMDTWYIYDTIKSIGPWAFENCKMYEIELPDGLESIEDNAFSGCLNLERLNIPEYVNKIGERILEYCNNLKSVTINSDEIDGIDIHEDAFSDIPSGCTLYIPYGQMYFVKNNRLFSSFSEIQSINGTEPIGWNTENAIRALCPIEGATIGQTSIKNIQLDKRDGLSGAKNGVAFFADSKNGGIIQSISIMYSYGFPSKWTYLGFDFSDSYNEWVVKFQNLGFEVYYIEQAHITILRGKLILKSILTVNPKHGNLRILLHFGNTDAEGTGLTSKNTLLRIELKLIDN